MKTILENVILSLTSYPARISTVHLTIESLLDQTVKAEEIILWLAEEEFANKEKELPDKLLSLTTKGLTIKWCGNIKSHKKLIPALKKYPEKVIITLDDDIIYYGKTIETLYNCHIQYPNDIIAHRISRHYFDKNNNYIHFDRPMYYDRKSLTLNYLNSLKKASFFNQQTGCGGVLYPPGCLHNDVLDENKCMTLLPTSDDLWFWLNGVRKKTKVRVPEIHFPVTQTIPGTQDIGLTTINDKGGFFDQQLNNIFEAYPEIVEFLQKENDENLSVINKIINNDDSIKNEIVDQYNNYKKLFKKTKDKELSKSYYEYIELMLKNDLYSNKKEKNMLLFEFYSKDMQSILIAIRKIAKKILNILKRK